MSLIKIQYSVNGTTPLAADKYIIQDPANPTALAVGEQVSLNFTVDGVYFIFVPVLTQVKVENASLVSWTSKTPFVNGTLIINGVIDPEADVLITIPVKVKVAPQLITKPFLNQVNAPIDTRLVLSKKEMLEINDLHQPDVYFALCKDDGHFYLYNKSAEKSDTTGKFTLITDIIEYNIKSIDGGEILEDFLAEE